MDAKAARGSQAFQSYEMTRDLAVFVAEKSMIPYRTPKRAPFLSMTCSLSVVKALRL